MAENRLARDLESRDTTQRLQQWKPAQLLPDPKPEQGYGFRWIRTAIMGKVDPTNTSAKFREGWVPVKAEDHPEMQLYADPNSRFKGNIEVGGLLLCKCPIEMIKQREAYYGRQASSQMEAVDNSFMRQSDARMPLFSDRKTAVSFGKGTK
jgi:hypothetical protein